MLKKLNNMKVRPKLIFCFVLVVCIASISGILGTILLLNMDSQYSNALVVNGFSQGEIGNLNTYINKGSATVRDLIMLSDPDELKEAQEELNTISQGTTDAFETITSKYEFTTDKELEYITTIEDTLPKYREIRDKVVELGLANKNDEALEMFRTEATPLLNKISDSAQGLADLEKTAGEEESTKLTAQSRLTVLIVIIVIATAIFISVLFAVTIAKSFAVPIIEIKDASAKLARGELDIDIAHTSSDELGDMADSFRSAIAMLNSYIKDLTRGLNEIANGNLDVDPTVTFKGDFNKLEASIVTIITSLSETLKQINEASDQVSAGSRQMAESAQSLAEGATDQAGAVEELTATIENVSQLVQTSAQNAGQAADDAKNYEKEAAVSNSEMEQLSNAMDQISLTSKKIESIITEIEDIASQTNLLSLNASIEAARAGEAGKGFAVVADQIGQLASESAQSAVNTRKLIENSLLEIARGNEITEKTMLSLSKVIDGIQSLAKASGEISNMSASQADAMNQIAMGIEQISEVVQNNSAAAQETSATSEELSAQSESLNSLIAQFKIKE